jgi:Peptidase family M28
MKLRFRGVRTELELRPSSIGPGRVPRNEPVMRSRWCLTLLFPSLLLAQSEDASLRAVASISPDDIRRRIGIIADDSMMGRDNPSPGLELTARYVASEFRRWGLRPGGDNGGYLQRFALTRWSIDTARSSVELTTSESRGTAPVGVEARYIDGPIPDAPIRGPVLLLGNPATPAREIPRDHLVLLVLDYSKPLPPSLGDDISRLAAAGPRAVLLLSNRDSTTFAERLRTARVPRLRRDSAKDTDSVAPVLELHERTLGSVLAAAHILPGQLRRSPREVRKSVPGLTAEVRLVRQILSRSELPNVIGILEGGDPALRREQVAFSAHIDHIGLSPGQPDSINNGADDNASGVAGLLELAEAFSQTGARPRRSLLFLAPSAEEPGLLGSAHFTEHPTVPLEHIVANINMDLIGRNWRDSVIAVGLEQSDLGATLDRVVQAHPELRMTPIPDRWPEERIFYRSDHYNFARKGVPILFFTSGTHPDYHRPADAPEMIDVEKQSRLVRLLFHLGTAVANQTARPRWTAESYRQIVERK